MLSKRDLMLGGSALLAVTALPASAQDKKKYIVQIPIDFDAFSRPIVDVTIGGDASFRFLIDTGAFGAAIREDVAKRLKLPQSGVIQTGSIKGHESNYIYTARDLLMGGIFKIPHMDLVGEDKSMGPGIDGILPASILTALPTELDYEAGMVRYYLGGAEPDLSGFTKADAEFQADTDGTAEKVYVTITLDGRKLLCLVDTGASTRLLIGSGFVSDHGLWKTYGDAASTNNVGGNGEVLKTKVARIPNIDIGGIHFDDLWCELAPPGLVDDFSSHEFDAIIGSGLWRQFTLAFAGHKTLYIAPNSRFSPSAGARPNVTPTLDARHPAISFVYQDRRILVPAAIKDKPPVPFMVNTASVHSGIVPSTAASFGLVAAEGGFDSTGLLLGAGWVPPHFVLAGRDTLVRRHLAGELGLDFLMLQPSCLDFDLNQIEVFPDAPPDLTGYTKIAQLPADGDRRFYVTIKLAGEDYRCAIDTAAAASVSFFPKAVQARGLWDKFANPDEHTTTVDGVPTKVRVAKVSGFDLGPFHLDTIPVTLQDPTMTTGSATVDGMVGMGFIQRCNWLFLTDGSLYAKPNSLFSAP